MPLSPQEARTPSQARHILFPAKTSLRSEFSAIVNTPGSDWVWSVKNGERTVAVVKLPRVQEDAQATVPLVMLIGNDKVSHDHVVDTVGRQFGQVKILNAPIQR